MTTYYLSGAMRGKPKHNRELFTEVEEALIHYLNSEPYSDVDDTIINPSNNFGGDQTRPVSDYMAKDLQQVLEADVIVQLPGWQESEGATREAQLALWAGKRFMKATKRYPESDWQFLNVDAPEFSDSIRAQACDEGKQLITGDRNNAYGPPTQDFRRSADASTAYGYRHTELPASAPPCPMCGAKPLAAHDTAILVDVIKTSRLMWTPTKRDSWVDKIGYSACGLECAVTEEAARLSNAADFVDDVAKSHDRLISEDENAEDMEAGLK